MTFQLSNEQIQTVSQLTSSENFADAYSFIADALTPAVQNGDVDSSTQLWFQWASEINGDTGSFVSEYTREFTRVGGITRGKEITDAEFQDASDKIAIKVLGDILNATLRNEDLNPGEIPTTPENIIKTDVAEGTVDLGIAPEDFSGTLVSGVLFGTDLIQEIIQEGRPELSTLDVIKIAFQFEKHAFTLASVLIENPDYIADVATITVRFRLQARLILIRYWHISSHFKSSPFATTRPSGQP